MRTLITLTSAGRTAPTATSGSLMKAINKVSPMLCLGYGMADFSALTRSSVPLEVCAEQTRDRAAKTANSIFFIIMEI